MRWPRRASRRREVEVFSGATPIGELRARERASVGGVVIALTYPPIDTPTPFAVRVSDGSGSLLLSFLGRRSVPGFEAGRRVIATGMVSEREGLLTMFDPHYRLLPLEEE